ncbi:PEP/pyruvate-binding domain-containing protein [Micromonospora sp. NPDC050200]|uniref:PEP/pyruvate-binding domain-containing protein n=1 Tax=Micromonospora sp. NPDC050200 TaxID=3155664 RepID=UPI003409AB40
MERSPRLTDTGFADRDTITVLRTIQQKVAAIVHGSDDRVTEVGPQSQPARSPISMDADDEYWTPFCRRFAFRPGMHSGEPAIAEPVPSVTADLGPIFAPRSLPEFAAGVHAAKQRAVHAPPAGGTQEVAIDPQRQEQPALTDAQVVRLVQLGRRIEAHFGRPQDIEWCLVDVRR